ncbi:hypothetical protein like AT1G43760 [Hibiscus trionum]|uniref:Reverse transcriptase n=1 Tax=Hibiscus trionum TaxID=183268 RepID=A0A9W7IYQ0_HIBTR|nr:hypothetical protein like AT1G43760 [Hibiscus trionum]
MEREFSMEEIKEALWSMDGSRAPGPDGFNAHFLKKFWENIKGKIWDFFAEFYNNQQFEKSVNHSCIVLIQKKQNPAGIGDYRPIS